MFKTILRVFVKVITVIIEFFVILNLLDGLALYTEMKVIYGPEYIGTFGGTWLAFIMTGLGLAVASKIIENLLKD